MNRRQWAENLSSFNWLCGRCESGHVKLDEAQTVTAMTPHTRELYHNDWFEVEMGMWRFATLAACDNPDCAEPFAVSGAMTTERQQVEFDGYEDFNTYRVKAVNPSPLPFPLPKNTPDPVRERIASAAGLIWVDHDAAGNKIRQAVEVLMDDRAIPRTTLSKPKQPDQKRVRVSLSLHARLERFAKQAPEASDHLMAIKFLGNAGSHADAIGLARDDVLDAFEILEQVLDDVYLRSRAKIAQKARRIIAARGPVRRPRKT